jgi:hypothetical protein
MSGVLIMAFDAGGDIRFVGDVQRGAACGCFCPMCKSPLVAKQGDTNEWHFSHEASQERPECEAGAENLARSLGIEFARELAQRGALELPVYQTTAGVSTAWLHRSQPVLWSAQITGPLFWREHPPKSRAVATGALDTGSDFALFVQVGAVGAPQTDDLPEDCAYGALVVSPSWPAGTRTREDAMAVLKRTVSFRWGYHPDTLGLLAAAQSAFETEESAVRNHSESMLRERANAAGRRWAEIGKRLERTYDAPPGFADEGPQSAPMPTHPASPPPIDTRYPAYPGHALGCNFQFFRLGPDEAWVFYSLDVAFIKEHMKMADTAQPLPTKLWAIAPARGARKGWDECLPPSVGIADAEHNVYWVRDHIAAVTFLSPRSKATFMSNDPAVFSNK